MTATEARDTALALCESKRLKEILTAGLEINTADYYALRNDLSTFENTLKTNEIPFLQPGNYFLWGSLNYWLCVQGIKAEKDTRGLFDIHWQRVSAVEWAVHSLALQEDHGSARALAYSLHRVFLTMRKWKPVAKIRRDALNLERERRFSQGEPPLPEYLAELLGTKPLEHAFDPSRLRFFLNSLPEDMNRR